MSDESKIVLDELSEGKLCELASDPTTPEDLLNKLANHDGTIIRLSVAMNPSTPLRLLEQLSDDVNSQVQACVAANPNTPLPILKHLRSKAVKKKNKRRFINIALAENPNTPKDMFADIWNDYGWDDTRLWKPEVIVKRKIEDYRQTEGLEGVPDSYIEKLLWGGPNPSKEAR